RHPSLHPRHRLPARSRRADAVAAARATGPGAPPGGARAPARRAGHVLPPPPPGAPRRERAVVCMHPGAGTRMKPMQAPSRSAGPPGREMQGMRVYLETYGCQMNEYDSELVRALLRDGGFRIATSPEAADVVLFNTCAIREHAHLKIYGRLHGMGRLRATN